MTDRRTEVVHVRCSPHEKRQWEMRSAMEGKDFSAWVREICEMAACDTLILGEVAEGHSKAQEVLDSIVGRIQDIRVEVFDVAKTLESRVEGEVTDLVERLKLSWAGLYGVVDRLSG